MEQLYVFVNTEDSQHRRTISSLFSKPLRLGRNVGMRTSGGYVRPPTHSVIDQVLESDVDNIFVHDTQRLENGNVWIPDVGIIHKITAHVYPSRRCGQHGDERNLQKSSFPRSVQDVMVWKIDSKSSSWKMSKHDVSPREGLVTTDAKHDDQLLKIKSSSYKVSVSFFFVNL
jgi:hypothetical protein